MHINCPLKHEKLFRQYFLDYHLYYFFFKTWSRRENTHNFTNMQPIAIVNDGKQSPHIGNGNAMSSLSIKNHLWSFQYRIRLKNNQKKCPISKA